VTGVTFDTGVLIALERASASQSERRARVVLANVRRRELRITVPSVVIVEWWRGQRGPAAHVLAGMTVEPLDEALARVAGEALARVKRSPSIVDAVVMASAARRGDVVYTADLADLESLRVAFPTVRVLAV